MTIISRIRLAWMLAGLLTAGTLAVVSVRALACPFCSAVALTFGEEIGNSQVAAIVKLTESPPRNDDPNASLDVAKAKFEVVKVLKGQEHMGGTKQIEAVYFGDSPVGTTFLIMGIDPPAINWSTPIAITERGVDYVTKAMDLPKAGPDRLVFFQDFLEDKDEMLARDAYDEFAKAPYADVLGLKERMHHDKLVAWVKSTEVPVSRRRLYLTMLGAHGNAGDMDVLEEMIKSKDRQTKGALDALVAAYLTIKGPEGMPLVEELFLKNKDAEYTDTYATIMALRFHGTEEKIIPKARLLGGLRLMLDRPQLADLVIPDLARWEDWSVVDKLVALFKNSDDESSWVRVPVINYLRACPLPEAKKHIDELAKIDPDSIKRANSFFALPGAAAPAGDTAKDTKEKKDGGEAEDEAKASATEAPLPPAAPGAESEPKSTQQAVEKKPSGESAQAAPAASGQGAAAPHQERVELSADKSAAALAGKLTRGAAAEPGPKADSLPIFGGLAAAAVLLGCAFWAILKGGQHAAG